MNRCYFRRRFYSYTAGRGLFCIRGDRVIILCTIGPLPKGAYDALIQVCDRDQRTIDVGELDRALGELGELDHRVGADVGGEEQPLKLEFFFADTSHRLMRSVEY